MGGDYTRFLFDAVKDHAGVLMQQGRVLLDADWNELVELLNRRWRAETIDIIGRGVVPKETPDGFKITLAGGQLFIGIGRIYVDGLLAENHGLPAPPVFDPVLDEVHGTLPVPYTQQPYFPNAQQEAPLPTGGSFVAYLDVWQREVSWLEEPGLVDNAVGVDTTTRVQTAWQVRWLEQRQAVTCQTPDAQLTNWNTVTQRSAGRLTTKAVGVPSSSDPCTIPPNAGFRGSENRLYRVEIHDPGPLGTATFKWSRDNGSVATAVKEISADRLTLTVVRTGRDAVLRFNPGDWVEITDDFLEFAGKPGEMRKIAQVDDVALTITLAQAVTLNKFDATDPNRHTRVRRWDQKGPNVDAANGVLATPAAPFVLEDGVEVTFTTDPANGQFKVGDYWVFAARTADASVEALPATPPRGIHHHYCRLAVVTLPGTVEDCRKFWPPDFAAGAGCDCTVCVSAASHNQGTLTIQMGIDQVKAAGGKVCLGPGSYHLREPLLIDGGRSVHIEGKGWVTQIFYQGAAPALTVRNSFDVSVDGVSFLHQTVAGPASLPIPTVLLQQSAGLAIRSCAIFHVDPAALAPLAPGPAIGLAGALFQVTLSNNLILAPIGVAAVAPFLISWTLEMEGNSMLCQAKGISLEGATAHLGRTQIHRNSVYGCSGGGIRSFGLLPPSSGVEIWDNELVSAGTGIVVGSDNTRVCRNTIARSARAVGDGISLELASLNKDGIDHCQVLENRIAGMGGAGIAIRAVVRSAMIKLNVIDNVAGGGIVMSGDASGGALSVANNQILGVALQAATLDTPMAAIRLVRVGPAQVTDNAVFFRRTAGGVHSRKRAGIQLISCSAARVSGNDVRDLGPSPGPNEAPEESVGIEVQGSFEQVEVLHNAMRLIRSSLGNTSWQAVRIGTITGLLFPFLTDQPVFFFKTSASTIHLSPTVVEAVANAAEFVTAVGNQADGSTFQPLVQMGVSGPCTFADNRCVMTPLTTGGASPEAVIIQAAAAIASANFLRSANADVAMRINVPATTAGTPPPFTVVSNITSAAIFVNGVTLAAPWVALNVRIP